MVQYWVTLTSDLPYDFREMETNCFFAGQEDTPNYDSPFKPDIWNMKISTGSKCLLQKIHRGLQQCQGFIRGASVQGPRAALRATGGLTLKGFPLGFLDLEATNWNNKIKQDACGIPGNHKKDTEVTTNFSNTVETRNTDGVTHNSSGHKCQVADLSINNIYWSLICTSCYTVHVWCTSVSHIYIYWSLLYTTPVLLHSAGTWYHITRSNLWQIQNNMLKTAIEI